MDEELPPDIHAQVETLCERGNIKSDAGLHDDAIAEWSRALAILPQPQTQWDAAMWLHASIADALRNKTDVEAALASFREAARCSDGGGNAFVQFGIGTCLFDLGHADEAVEPLLRAYMMEGEDIFQDGGGPEYLNLLRHRNLVD